MQPVHFNHLTRFTVLIVLTGLLSCNGVPNQTMKNDSIKAVGRNEQDQNHTGGAGDSAKNQKDSTRVVHGGELKK